VNGLLCASVLQEVQSQAWRVLLLWSLSRAYHTHFNLSLLSLLDDSDGVEAASVRLAADSLKRLLFEKTEEKKNRKSTVGCPFFEMP
jgi:hypothetical protein